VRRWLRRQQDHRDAISGNLPDCAGGIHADRIGGATVMIVPGERCMRICDNGRSWAGSAQMWARPIDPDQAPIVAVFDFSAGLCRLRHGTEDVTRVLALRKLGQATASTSKRLPCDRTSEGTPRGIASPPSVGTSFHRAPRPHALPYQGAASEAICRLRFLVRRRSGTKGNASNADSTSR